MLLFAALRPEERIRFENKPSSKKIERDHLAIPQSWKARQEP